jgi:hypothetical protein
VLEEEAALISHQLKIVEQMTASQLGGMAGALPRQEQREDEEEEWSDEEEGMEVAADNRS